MLISSCRYKFKNRNGVELDLLTLGGIIESVRLPDRNGGHTDVVLGFDHLENGISELVSY